VFQPGFVGGHCVIPNTYLLEQVQPSPFIEAIRHSNDRKQDELAREGRDLETGLHPTRPG
jgi:UDP-N-acetyl-D-mannosaminuronate dehydrogenase